MFQPIFIFLVWFIVVSTGVVYAQQDPSYSNYPIVGIAYNPAIAGNTEYISIAALYRRQWPKINGLSTQHVQLHAPVFHRSVGVGATFTNDENALYNVVSANGVYAYKINFKAGVLSFGLRAGMQQYSFQNKRLDPKDVDDEVLRKLQNYILPDIGSGIFYADKKFSIGFSAEHLIKNGTSHSRIFLSRHYYLTGNYIFNSKGYFNFIPGILYKKAVSAPGQMDCNLFVKSPQAGAGMTYRTNDILSFQLILYLNELFPAFSEKLVFGYSYDYSVSSIYNSGNGANEFFLRYDFVILPSIKKIKKQPKSLSPITF